MSASTSIPFHDGLPVLAGGAAPTCAGLDAMRIISAAGDDALAFLHGQLTQDVTGQPVDRASLAGYCTAKGRLLATLVMWRAWTEPAEPTDARWHALVRADLAEALVKRLSMFVLRAKARLSVSATQVDAVASQR